MLEAAGLRENVVVQWWRYREPTLVPRPDLGLRAWVTPMAGYWSNFFTQSYTSNIYSMLLHGYRAGAEGADAYCIYDPAFDRNYTCWLNFAWNQSASEDLYNSRAAMRGRNSASGWIPRWQLRHSKNMTRHLIAWPGPGAYCIRYFTIGTPTRQRGNGDSILSAYWST